MTTTNQSGTIDGISYASSEDVYDTLGYGVVTQILYFDQSGAQVADRQLFFNLSPATDYGVDAKTVNPDGTFSFEIQTPGGTGIPNPYVVDTFSSAGILIREDSYTPVYVSSGVSFEGIAGNIHSQTVYDSTSPSSSGIINGAYYDTVETVYNTSGQAIEIQYLNDLHDTATVVGTQVLASPDPIFAVPAAATATAGAPQALIDIGLADDWAGLHPGTLALNVSVDSGTISGFDQSGNAFTLSAGMTERFTGTLAQINADLGDLTFTGSQTGTAHVTFQAYDQAGIQASATETITVGGAGPATAPNPVLTGISQASVAVGSPLILNNITATDPWAAAHAGSLALTVTTNLGTLTDVNSAEGVTGNGTAALRATGSLSQIDNDLAGLVLNATQAGTANVEFALYDQAGLEATHLVGVTMHA